MKPITSLRILDITENNPYISSIFADYGAEVIKIEKPNMGDRARRRGAKDGETEGPYAEFYMRGKKSVAIDIDTKEGAEVIRRLAAKSDIFITGKKEAQMEDLGISYEVLKVDNKKLIYAAVTPFGEKGPWADMPDYDLLAMAKTGLLEKTGFPDKPTKFGFDFAYCYTAWHLAAACLASYLKAMETGEGMKVSTSTWQVVSSLDDTFAQCLLALNDLPVRLGNGFPTINPTDTFECKDGYFSLSIGSDKQWLDFVHSARKDEVWGDGTKYGHDPARSMDHYFGDLDGQLKDFFKTLTIEEADMICRQAMVPGGPCNTVTELMHDPQVADRKMLVDVGGVIQYGKPAKFSRDNEHDNEIAPAHALGADTDEVLKALGM